MRENIREIHSRAVKARLAGSILLAQRLENWLDIVYEQGSSEERELIEELEGSL